MSRQRAGLKKEHEIAAEIFDATGGSVMPLRAGWSGNSAVPAPDLLIPLNGTLRALELKTSDQKRLTVTPEDVADVIAWSGDMTEVPTFPYISIKFNRYEPVTFRLVKPWDVQESFEYIHESTSLDTNVTSGGNITFGHPTHYDCDVTSMRKSPGAGVAILDSLDGDEYANDHRESRDVVGVYEVLQEHPEYWEQH